VVREAAIEGLILRAARYEGGSCTQVDVEEAVRAVREPGPPVWVDVVAEDHDKTRAILQDQMGFHELAVEDALSDRERPALQDFDGLVFLVVPAVICEDHEERYVEVGFFLNDHALVTVSREKLPLLDRWFKRWNERPGHLGKSPAYLLHAIVDAMVDEYFTVVDDVEDVVEDLSDNLFAGEEGRLEEIVKLKRRLMKLRRIVTPVRDVLNAVLRRDIEEIPEDAHRYFQDVYDHILRIAETVDALREALTSMVDIHLSNVSNNVNLILKKMAVLSTVLMTMTIVSSIYGMNFFHMPELHWRYGYPFALGLMVVLSAGVLAIFKRIRWI
jgi:magnesium transporter